MEEFTTNGNDSEVLKSETESVLDQVLREGARKMLIHALELEVEDYINAHKHERDQNNQRKVVRNGYHAQRKIVTGAGQMQIKVPGVDDRRLKSKREDRFTSAILPAYMRRTPSIDNLVPALYLSGVSTSAFQTALASILGEGIAGLSATNIVRLKRFWEDEFLQWEKRDLKAKEYAYIWVDGIYFNVRLDDQRSCILVIMGADKDGKKELLAVSDGYRESSQSWREILLQLKARGLTAAPRLAIGDGALGFWNALDEIFPETKKQRCWVHKTANVLNKMPRNIQGKAKSMIHEMYMADTEQNALKAYDLFIDSFQAKYPRATQCLEKDREKLFTFYKFPAMHWTHIRTTNPIESTFATVRLRTKRTRGCGSRVATLSMVWKLCLEAEKNWRKLRGYKLIPRVIEGVFCKDGVFKEEAA